MKLENNFTIHVPIDTAWEALNNPETVAPCFPGATLTSYEGDSFAGTVKVKLGPIAMTYKGKGTYVSRDDAAHEVVIEANGRDSRGNGTANATVTASMVAEAADRTAVSMITDMTITGKPAQFGRGVIADVADKIIGQFAACVARKLGPAEEDGGAGRGVGDRGLRGDLRHPDRARTTGPARDGPGGRLGGDLGLGPGTGVDERRGGTGHLRGRGARHGHGPGCGDGHAGHPGAGTSEVEAPSRGRRSAASDGRPGRPGGGDLGGGGARHGHGPGCGEGTPAPRGRGPRRWRRPPPTWLPTRPRRRRPPPPAPRRPPAARGSAAPCAARSTRSTCSTTRAHRCSSASFRWSAVACFCCWWCC